MGQEKYTRLYKTLLSKIDRKRIFRDPLYTLAYGSDASFYRLVPMMVIKALDEREVSFILKEASKLSVPVTFRAAGTSLSGQALTDSVLIVAGENWNKYNIEENGEKITLQPGLTGGYVNSMLRPYGRKIGPDPASINAAMIGGIAANNASGMCCGTSDNSYKTLDSIRVILADGTILDTGSRSSRDEFRRSQPLFLEQIEKLAETVKENAELSERIARKFRIKNTMGYSLNALIDFPDPFDIIGHLMIGSEGTLGFISEIRFRTVVEHPFRASSLMIFPDIEKACMAVSLLKSSPVAAVELIDRTGLRSVEKEPGIPDYIRDLGGQSCALLVETTSANKQTLQDQIKEIRARIRPVSTELPVEFSDDPEEYEKLWKIRKGLFPSVGAMRKTGTTVIMEAVVFPVGYLAKATLDLRRLLEKYGYHDAVIFGHALEGNLHFVFAQDFSTTTEVSRYAGLMEDVAGMVLDKYDGSLKGEHGTGRNMAPFVEMEWGRGAYRLMKDIKELFDPDNILNPGVIFNDDLEVHLKSLKPVHPADEIIDKCTDCGFCETSCVSAGLTLTPRQRIVVYREMSGLGKNGHDPDLAATLSKSYDHAGIATCATDGLCALSCPVKIDTGEFIKSLRARPSPFRKRIAAHIAANMDRTTGMARAALSFAGAIHRITGDSLMQSVTGAIRKITGGRTPQWNPYLPKAAKRTGQAKINASGLPRKVVYFPSCINRAMGVSKDHRDEPQLTEKISALLNKAGYEPVFPENLDNLCCGMAFSSKGYTDIAKKKSVELEAALIKASENGRFPVLCDMSPCLLTMRENMGKTMKLYEPVEFIIDYLLPYLKISPVDETVSVFQVCSMKKMGLENKLFELASKCATRVVVPGTNCCGFAGDKGFFIPELNSHGLRELKPQLAGKVQHGYSTSRTCETGLSLHSGLSHKSIIYLVDRASSPTQNIQDDHSLPPGDPPGIGSGSSEGT